MYYNNIKSIGFYDGVIPWVDNDELKKHIYETKTKYPSMEWTRQEDEMFPKHPELDKVIKYIQDQWAYRYQQDLFLLEFWAHIHKKNMSTMTHNHLSSKDYKGEHHLSGVYYVQVPKDSGEFVLTYPDIQYTTSQYIITPEAHKFLLFDSVLNHHVTRNHSEQERISISFNFKKVDRVCTITPKK